MPASAPDWDAPAPDCGATGSPYLGGVSLGQFGIAILEKPFQLLSLDEGSPVHSQGTKEARRGARSWPVVNSEEPRYSVGHILSLLRTGTPVCRILALTLLLASLGIECLGAAYDVTDPVEMGVLSNPRVWRMTGRACSSHHGFMTA